MPNAQAVAFNKCPQYVDCSNRQSIIGDDNDGNTKKISKYTMLQIRNVLTVLVAYTSSDELK